MEKATQGYIFGWITRLLPLLFMEFPKPKTSWKTSCFFLNDAIFWRCFWKNIDVDVFDDVLQNSKHRANDASDDVNRPPLSLALSLVNLIHCRQRVGSRHHLNNKIDSISNCHCHLNPGRRQRTTTPLLHCIEVQCLLTVQNSATQCMKMQIPCSTMQWIYTGTIF